MASFWLTFRLKQDRTYAQRYQELLKKVDEAGTTLWDEPTSFIAFSSNYAIDPIGNHLKAAIDESVDVFVLREIGKDDTRYAGTLEKPASFRVHFPSAKKL
jgi:hypothetical protein